MSARATIPIPEWLDRLFTLPVMVYRKYKYGYTFRRIYLGEGEWTKVDADIYYRYGHLKWSIDGKNHKFYAVCNIKLPDGSTKEIRLHRIIMNAPDGTLVDHRNSDSLGNLRQNLRLATQSQNMQNRRKKLNTSSKYVGVWRDKQRNQWEVRIVCQGKRIWIGRFLSEIDAAKAYDKAARKYFGKDAKQNFPRNIVSKSRKRRNSKNGFMRFFSL